MVIFDLRTYRKAIEDFVLQSLGTFCAEHNNEYVAAVGLMSQPYNGWVWLCVHTLATADAKDDVIQDCAEWTYDMAAEFERDEWKETYYESTDSIKIISLAGREIIFSHESGGDEDFARPFFDAFVEILRGLVATRKLAILNCTESVLFGVQVPHQDLDEFWMESTLGPPIGNES